MRCAACRARMRPVRAGLTSRSLTSNLLSTTDTTFAGGCKNTLPDRKCSRLQRRGKCGRVFARNRCRQTCGLCLDRDELFAAASPPPPPRRGFAAFVKDPDNDQDRAINSYLGLIQTMHGAMRAKRMRANKRTHAARPPPVCEATTADDV